MSLNNILVPNPYTLYSNKNVTNISQIGDVDGLTITNDLSIPETLTTQQIYNVIHGGMIGPTGEIGPTGPIGPTGGSGNVTTSGMTAGYIPISTSLTDIENSIMSGTTAQILIQPQIDGECFIINSAGGTAQLSYNTTSNLFSVAGNQNIIGNQTLGDINNGTPGCHCVAATGPTGYFTSWFIPFDPNNPINTLGNTGSPAPPKSIRIEIQHLGVTGASNITLQVVTPSSIISGGYIFNNTNSLSGSVTNNSSSISGGPSMSIVEGITLGTTYGISGFIDINYLVSSSSSTNYITITGTLGFITSTNVPACTYLWGILRDGFGAESIACGIILNSSSGDFTLNSSANVIMYRS
jgi:hypothetical protein